MRDDVAARLWPRVVVDSNGCWIWTGAKARGYGQISIDGKRVRVHRLTYEETYGAIEPSLVIDHLCRVRSCVNPEHLDTVSNRTNILRGVGPTARNAQKTHCKFGHPFDLENTYWSVKGRECRICKQRLSRQRQEKRRAAA